jgi:hypothetical protein
MEISRRHLQETERLELAEALGPLGSVAESQLTEAQERAAKMQAQLDGMTRNQRRQVHKQMAKAARKGK